ncbi:MAG: hypothetical protein AAGA92_06450 [Planctomycetota bacterium]
MSESTPQPDALDPADAELLELYLDGQLAGDRAAQAQARIAEVPAMQAAVAQQEQIDGSLKRQLQAPAVSDDFLQSLVAGGKAVEGDPSAADEAPLVTLPPRDANRQRRTQLLAVAASLACVALWGSFGWDQLKLFWEPAGAYPQISVAQVYQGAVDRGFEPDWLCEDEQEFAQTFADRQGQALLLEPLPEGIRMAGLAYLDGFTPQATSMFAYVDDRPVLVMVGRRDEVSSSLLDGDPAKGIAVFTRKLANLTLVEVTPFEEPRVLDSLTLAEVPSAPTGRVPGAPLH